MKAKIVSFWWRHAHSLGVWWIILGIITVSLGIYIVYDEGAGMVWEIAIGVVVLVAGIILIQTSNRREAQKG